MLKPCLLLLLEWIFFFNIIVAVDKYASTNADHADHGLVKSVCVCVFVLLAYSCTINFTQRVGTPARVQLNCHLVSNHVLKPAVPVHTFAYISLQPVCCLGKIVSPQDSLKKHQLDATCFPQPIVYLY